jgi:CheY-like chemotaxis protein
MRKNVSTILLVDDDLAINYLHKRLLNKLAFGETIISVYNGASAINELISLNCIQKEDDLVIIFLDLNMPVMDGWEFLEQFKNIHNELKFQYKIIVLSSSINPDDIKRATINSFVSEYFSKPLTHNNITNLKEKYL